MSLEHNATEQNRLAQRRASLQAARVQHILLQPHIHCPATECCQRGAHSHPWSRSTCPAPRAAPPAGQPWPAPPGGAPGRRLRGWRAAGTPRCAAAGGVVRGWAAGQRRAGAYPFPLAGAGLMLLTKKTHQGPKPQARTTSQGWEHVPPPPQHPQPPRPLNTLACFHCTKNSGFSSRWPGTRRANAPCPTHGPPPPSPSLFSPVQSPCCLKSTPAHPIAQSHPPAEGALLGLLHVCLRRCQLRAPRAATPDGASHWSNCRIKTRNAPSRWEEPGLDTSRPAIVIMTLVLLRSPGERFLFPN